MKNNKLSKAFKQIDDEFSVLIGTFGVAVVVKVSYTTEGIITVKFNGDNVFSIVIDRLCIAVPW